MAKWRHLRMSVNYHFTDIEIFPAGRIDLGWLFKQFPKIKKDRSSDESRIMIRAQGNEFWKIEEAILNYLEETGWEGYAFTNSWGGHFSDLVVNSFKREVD